MWMIEASCLRRWEAFFVLKRLAEMAETDKNPRFANYTLQNG